MNYGGQIKKGQATGTLRVVKFEAVDPLVPTQQVDVSASLLAVLVEKPDGSVQAGANNAGGTINNSGVTQPDLIAHPKAKGACTYTATAGELDQLGFYRFIFSAPDIKTEHVLVEVVADDQYDAAARGLTNLDAATSTRLAGNDARLNNLDAAVSTRLAPAVAGRTLAVDNAGHAGIDWANVGGQATAVNLSNTTIAGGGGGGGGGPTLAQIFTSIVEGPNQIDGGGEVTNPPTSNVTFVQLLRELASLVSNNATNLETPNGGTAILKSRGGTRNRVVYQMNAGNRSVTSRDNS